MKFIKAILLILGICAVLGVFYGLAMLGPGAKAPEDYVYVDPEADARSILLESEKLYSEFEKAAAVSTSVSKDNIEKLKRAIALQEIT